MISSKNERVFIRSLSDLTLQIIFHAWWASMNVGSSRPVAWNDSRYLSSWQLYLRCRMEETSSPGIMCIVCHKVLCHSLAHGISSMGRNLLAEAYIAYLNSFTELEVTELTSSTIDETALAILMRQGSQGIPIVSLQRKFIFVIQVNPSRLKWGTKCSKPAAMDFQTFELSPRHLELLPHVTIYFSSYSMECYIKSRATRVIWRILKWPSAAGYRDPQQRLPVGISDDCGCN